MNASFLAKLARMFADNPRLSLTSGFRTRAEQEKLYKEKPGLAAPPGRSRHEKGNAADIGPASEYQWISQNLGKYGLNLPMPGKEPWHVEPTGAAGDNAPEPSPSQGGGMAASKVGFGGGGGGLSTGALSFANGMLQIASGLLGSASGRSASSGSSKSSGGSSSASSSGGGGGGGSVASIEDALRVAKAAGFSGKALQQIVAIGMSESGLKTGAIGDVKLENSTWGPSVGLWQIRTLKADRGKGTTRDQDALLSNPAKQAKSAWEISKGGSDFGAWSMYKNGNYAKNMGAVQQVMTSKGIGDPVGREDGMSSFARLPSPVMMSSGSTNSGGSPITVQKAEFNFRIDSASPAEAERMAHMIKDILSSSDRLMEAGDQ